MHVGDIQEAAMALYPTQWYTTYQVLPAWQAIDVPQYILSAIKYGFFLNRWLPCPPSIFLAGP